jgi:hypothetical protein
MPEETAADKRMRETDKRKAEYIAREMAKARQRKPEPWRNSASGDLAMPRLTAYGLCGKTGAADVCSTFGAADVNFERGV